VYQSNHSDLAPEVLWLRWLMVSAGAEVKLLCDGIQTLSTLARTSTAPVTNISVVIYDHWMKLAENMDVTIEQVSDKTIIISGRGTYTFDNMKVPTVFHGDIDRITGEARVIAGIPVNTVWELTCVPSGSE
jgi:hypothetical protein